ncbi:DinB family protein [Chryseolinea lacunae]|uniref:DinB family protein n=1 Tax=Chryseolinea lacunae TaxID=2801331 RepID=A0ABS1KZ28_9BACT|nr:DinB family protein [Chryseolinea lacunae]MBL0744527.1 DinB family protein [Chryseolinea lacunae]
MNPLLLSLHKIFARDLAKLEEEIKQYPTEESLWNISGAIKNPGGNLCLHLCGNLQNYIGAVLGNTGYVRNRDLEFSARNIARKDLLAEIQKTRQAVSSTLEKMDPAVLEQEYPAPVFDYPMTTSYFLIHLSAHLGYHLGQVNYHRRLSVE